MQEDPLGDWVVYLDDLRSDSRKGRWLLSVISELLQVPPYSDPGPVLKIVDELIGVDTAAGRRYPCPCCECLTLAEAATGTHQTCPVCHWEDDRIQFEDPTYHGGANKVSLMEARENFRLRGTSDPDRARRRLARRSR